jgi:mono/diheme cytochrome c family protein
MKHLIAAFALLAAFAPTARAGDGLPEKIAAGREFASRACGTCHLVAQEGAETPARRPSAPALAAVAQRPEVTETSLRKLLAANHHNFRASSALPNHAVSDDQTEGLVAYLLSLKSAN